LIRCFEHLLGTGADGNIVRKIHPSHDAIRIEEKFGRPRDVRAFRSSPGMQDVIPANSLGAWIGEQRKRVAQLLRLPSIDVRRINADGDNANTARLEF
jgi:hypothetical protein